MFKYLMKLCVEHGVIIPKKWRTSWTEEDEYLCADENNSTVIKLCSRKSIKDFTREERRLYEFCCLQGRRDYEWAKRRILKG